VARTLARGQFHSKRQVKEPMGIISAAPQPSLRESAPHAAQKPFPFGGNSSQGFGRKFSLSGELN
jgi:hypothetical protein